ncbi:MAG: Rieske 2Fe-2S domain-containing protein [Deltaproteobacteria bacterium]|nr:Rieske 2Fe-2S domain-containing protein [Deltaproteobacteria bacterium]MBT4642727.1 Rieske 2Fe-2S domain-containing protein [Deltaproteobacteria bacterium]MBT6503248.1 Rieske 2Fe-2S domain-containing protein [Deltaproteobacteria bacterium]MBT7154992.1 Rieske 2Fe-2S domain-containing protein [Deltaproteobacteria bacterium]MBT7710739.1 Rieske 2Fe-2S domain-containing protein [Deltaproteobacteria bacterium]
MSQSHMSTRLVRVFRYDPMIGGEGHFDEYTLEIEDDTNTTILDVLIRIQKEQDPSLAFRYACRVNMCGSCAMVINGQERLACKTNVSDICGEQNTTFHRKRVTAGNDTNDKSTGREITIRPLNHFPVVRDLVVDMEPFFDKFEKSIPYFEPAEHMEEPAVIAPDARERLDIGLATECILCGCCVSSCTMVHYHDGYVGPAALNRAFTLLADSRDGLHDLRMNQVLDSCYNCRTEFNCTEVCPKEISPTRSIKYIQLLAAKKSLSGKGKRAPDITPEPVEPTAVEPVSAVANNLPNPDRRRFLKNLTFGLGTISAAVVGGVAATAAIGPALEKGKNRWIRLSKLDSIAVGEVTTVTMEYEETFGFHHSRQSKPVLVSRPAEDNNIVVYSSTCTHLGCTVSWDENKRQYVCACHGGAFDEHGNVVSGPPPRPLDRFVYKIEDEHLFVELV